MKPSSQPSRNRPGPVRGFRVGDSVFFTTMAGFVPGNVVAPANRSGKVGLIRVRDASGREREAPVQSCYFDTPAFRAFSSALRARSSSLSAASAAAQSARIIFGSRRSTTIPAYVAFVSADRASAANGREVARTHPYR